MAGRIITIAQQKGGAGKTTLAAHLAVALADSGSRVAIVDIDPQGSLTRWHELRSKRHTDQPALRTLTHARITGWRTEREVTRLADTHDIVLVDNPPHAETEARIAIRAADLVLVPAQPSPMDLWATEPVLDLAAQEKRAALLVLNRVPPKGRLADTVIAQMALLDAPIARARIGNRVDLAAALLEGLGITEYARRSASSGEIIALALEVLAAASRGAGALAAVTAAAG